MTDARLVPDRLITILGTGILAILGAAFILMYTEPYGGDFLGPAQVALLVLLPPCIAYAVTLAVWVAFRRVSLLLAASTLAGLMGLSTVVSMEWRGGYLSAAMSVLMATTLLWPPLVVGAGEVLRRHRRERRIALLLLLGLAVLGILARDLLSILVPGASAAAVLWIGRRAGTLPVTDVPTEGAA